MAEWIRLYQEDRFEKLRLEQGRALTIGEGRACEFRLPKGCAPGGDVRIERDGNAWRASWQGRSVFLRGGEFLPIEERRRVALEYVCEDERGEAAELCGGEWRIGRAEGCNIRLKHERVSSNHAKLYLYGGAWHICDLSSVNGTFVNGKRIQDAALREGDEIAVGPYALEFSSGRLWVAGGRAELNPPERPARPAPAEGRFRRSPRMRRARPEGEMEIEAAPSIGAKPEINWLTALLPSIGSLGVSVALSALTGSTGMLMSAPMMLIGVGVTLINYRSQKKKFAQSEDALQQKYRSYLKEKEDALREAARVQRDAALHENPDPQRCLRMAQERDSRLWERTAADEDFLSLRAGLGEEALGVQTRVPKLSLSMQDAPFADAPQRLADAHRSVQGVPVCCDLLRERALGVAGRRALAVRMGQALLVQLCALHGCDGVRLAVVFPEDEREAWMWTRWLPHCWNEERTRRYVACGRYEAGELFSALEPELRRRAAAREDGWNRGPRGPHWVFFVADARLLPQRAAQYLSGGAPTLSSVLLADEVSDLPAWVSQILEARGAQSTLARKSRPGEVRTFEMDQLSLGDCDAFARALAPLRLDAPGAEAKIPNRVTLLEGYRCKNPEELEIGEFWDSSCSWRSLSVPIGEGAAGTYYFDIHEKGSGPHGLVAGTNGSGKSEMAQSWIASMALQFSPQDVNFVLVDFKGTSLLAPLRELPHLAGSISNLDSDVQRCLKALDYEIVHRQQLVDRWGVPGIIEYQKKRANCPEMEEMPFLILVIDEFADFKAQFPDFTGALDHIFRGGRSLGICTVIMTQKPAGVVTEQMSANARFRWCLKVMSESDSREMLGVSDAAFLNVPGRAYVKTEAGAVDLVQPYFSGAPYELESRRMDAAPRVARVALDGSRAAAQGGAHRGAHGTQLEAVVRAVAAHCRRRGIAGAKPIWLPPLEDKLELAALLPQGRLWESARDWGGGAQLRAVLGRIDDPARQRQDALEHDFLREGNLLVYGMPLSGKTTLLSTLAVSLCCACAPDELQLYLMEFGGYALRGLENFPQVAGAAGDDEPEIMAKIAAAFSRELSRRKQLFRRCGVGSFAAYREEEALPAWVLLLDNLNLCCVRFMELTDELTRISREGEAFGLYLAASVTGVSGLSYQLSQNFKRVLALQLADSTDYTSLVGRVYGNMPRKTIGRGLVAGPLEFQAAIAFADEGDRARAARLRELAERMRGAWPGELPKKIRSLPDFVPYGSVKGEPLVLGLSRADGEALCLPLRDTVSLLVSAADGEALRAAWGPLARQLGELPGIELLAFSRDCPAGARRLADADALLEALVALAPEMRRRQAARREGSAEEFAPVVIAIEDLGACLDSAPDEMVSRLEVLVRLGRGLNFTLLAAGLAQDLEKHCFAGNILMETLLAGAVLLAGGEEESHRIVDVSALARSQRGVLAQGSFVLARDGGFAGVKPMEDEEVRA